MEHKVIIYIIVGIVYFLYSINKKVQEEKTKQTTTPAEQDESSETPSKPVSPPTGNPLEDIMREIKRKQAEIESQKKVAAPKQNPIPAMQQKEPEKKALLRETKSTTASKGNVSKPTYQRELKPEVKPPRENIRLENEGTYKIQTMEEAQTQSDAERDYAFELDAKRAFIGSVIFERKY